MTLTQNTRQRHFYIWDKRDRRWAEYRIRSEDETDEIGQRESECVSGSVFSVILVAWVSRGKQVTQLTPASKWRWMHLISLLSKLHLRIETQAHMRTPRDPLTHLNHQSNTGITPEMFSLYIYFNISTSEWIKFCLWPRVNARMSVPYSWVCLKQTKAAGDAWQRDLCQYRISLLPNWYQHINLRLLKGPPISKITL